MDPISLKQDYANGQVFSATRMNSDMSAVQTAINTIINSTTDGASGGDAVKMTPITGLGDANTNTAQKITEALYTAMLALVAGQIPDASISAAKLDFDPATQTELNALAGSNVPVGGIIMYEGAFSAIPANWALCDGNNSTPNLADKFITGTTAEIALGVTGGSNNTTLTTTQLPAHTHTASTNSTGAHTHTAPFADSGNLVSMPAPGDPSVVLDGTTNTSSSGAHAHTVTVDSSGSGTAYDSRPAYYKLAYIKRIS